MKHLLAIAALLLTASHVCAWELFKSDQTKAQELMTEIINGRRQAMVEKWHLLATAKKVTIHDVVMIDSAGAATTSGKKMVGCLVRCTFYWEGPVNKDGYTKVAMLFDAEVQRFTAFRVLSTNGILNSDAAAGALSVLDALLSN